MARFLTPQWVDELNAALEGATPPDPPPDAGLALTEGPVTVVQEVRGTPEGDVRLVLRIDTGAIRLALDGEVGGGDSGDPAPTVTIALSYEAASAMSQGQLSPAQALNEGRIRVRGDLAALAAAQAVLHDVRTRTGAGLPATTY